MRRNHDFTATITWSSDTERPHPGRGFSRNHEISVATATPLPGSSAPVFHGDATRWNPEQLFISAVAQCHMLTFLFLAAQQGFTVISYRDDARGTLVLDADGRGGEFDVITLTPQVTVESVGDHREIDAELRELHDRVGSLCFIARSIRARVVVDPHHIIVGP